MKDTDWMILDELYRLRNITKAAYALYMTQPALTKRIQLMEQEFGTQILLRGKYGVEFTAAGAYLAQCASRQVEFMSEVLKKLEYLKNMQKGTLILGTSYSFCRFQMPALLAHYRELYPQVDVELCCVKSGKLVQMMELGQVHAAFVRGQFETGMECVEISREQGCILSRDPVALEDLPGLDRIIYDISGPSQVLIDQWWKQQYETEPKITLNAAFIDNAWNMAKQGLGYTISFLTQEQMKDIGLHVYPMKDTDGSPVMRSTYFLYQDQEEHPEYIRAFIKMILEQSNTLL